MSIAVIKNTKLYVGPYDFTGQINALALDYGAKPLDATTMAEDTIINLGGLKTVKLEFNGLWEPPDLEQEFFDNMGLSDHIFTASPQGAAGDPAFFCRPNLGEYNPGGKVGELYAFKVSASGPAILVRGLIGLAKAARIISGVGAGYELGAVTADQQIYAALHLTAASGTLPTLDVIVQSDADDDWLSPTTRLTFTQKTAAGQQWQEAAGPITDTWWRVSYTIAGTTPSFTFAVALGIF